MKFGKKNIYEEFGKVAGFILMYLIFTTLLFFILKVTKRLPLNWNYFYIMNISLLIVLTGILIKKLLK